MADADRLTRLLTLVPWLTAHSGVSKAVAAAHFDISVRQLESDLELITFTGPGLYGGDLVDIYFDDETITVFDSQGLDRPLQLSGDEISSLLVGLRALQQLPDVDAVAIASAITKLSGDSRIDDVAVDVTTADVAAVVTEALRARRDLEIEYLHPLRDDTTRRTVTPLRLFSADGADYLDAWCHAAAAHRTFRLDRMLSCELGAASEPAPEEPVQQHHRSRAEVDVEPWALHVLEGVPAVVTSTDQRVHATVDYSDERWLVRWAIASGAGVTVARPAGVQDSARRLAEAALVAYGEV